MSGTLKITLVKTAPCLLQQFVFWKRLTVAGMQPIPNLPQLAACIGKTGIFMGEFFPGTHVLHSLCFRRAKSGGSSVIALILPTRIHP